jgi:ParB-like chromosome segregation protein Spo0J
MSERDAFTPEQWQALVEAPPAIARAVASVAGSPGQTETELGAFLELVDRAAADDAGGLLGAIVGDVHGRLAGGLPPEPLENAFMDGVEAARRAGAILSVQADPSEAARVRAWMLSVAQVVASAAREGGVLGIGGEHVSEREEQTIAAIRDALGVDTPDES